MKSFRPKISNYPEEFPIHYIHYSETIGALKPFLNVSRVFGVPHFSVIDSIVSRGGLWSFLALLSIFLLCNQVFLFVTKVLQGEDFVRRSGPELILRIHVILVLLWSLVYSVRLAEALRNSPVVENRINKVYSSDDTDFLGPWALRRKCILWTVVYILLSIGLTLKPFMIDVLTGSKSFPESWESYGEESCGLPPGMLLHFSVASGYCLAMDLATNFLWLFGDFLLLLVALVMAHMFRRINSHGIKRIEPTRLSSIEIDLVREHHGLTSKLVKEFDDAIASLNLISVVLTSAYIILTIYSIVTFRRGERQNMSRRIFKLYCKIGVAIFKLLAGLIFASILHHRAHEGLSEIRSWPMAREFSDFSLNNGRASVMQAFVSQLSQGSIGLTVGKLVPITGKLMTLILLGIGVFLAFARITISSCTRGSRSP